MKKVYTMSKRFLYLKTNLIFKCIVLIFVFSAISKADHLNAQPLSGVYTIDTGSTASNNYLSFAAAQADLINRGVSGAVTFNIAPAEYFEFLTLPPITGSSVTNTITFDGGDADTTKMIVDGDTNAVIKITGADYITIKNLTIKNTSDTLSWGVYLTSQSDYVTIDSCVVEIPQRGGTSTSLDAIGASSSLRVSADVGDNANYLTISNNRVFGGYRGINVRGIPGSTAADPMNTKVTIKNNWVEFSAEGAIKIDQYDTVLIEGNTVLNMTTADGNGLDLDDSRNITILRNDITATDKGMNIDDVRDMDILYNKVMVSERYGKGIEIDDLNDAYLTATVQSKVINNMVISGGIAFDFDDAEKMDIYHNSVLSHSSLGMKCNDNIDMNLVNNIITAGMSAALWIVDATPPVWNRLDNNVYFNFDSTSVITQAAIRFGRDTIRSLTSWRTKVPSLPQLNSRIGDPDFNSATDLHINIGGLVNGAGDNSVGVSDDIDGDARPYAPSSTVDIGADEFFIPDNDAGLTDYFSSPCLGNNALSVIVINFGADTLNSVTVNWNADDGTTSIIGQKVISGLQVPPGKDILLKEIDSINYSSAKYDLSLYTSLPNGNVDGKSGNDTLRDDYYLRQSFYSVSDTTVCSGDTATLHINGNLFYEWYANNDSSDQNIISLDDSLNTGMLTQDTVFWVEEIFNPIKVVEFSRKNGELEIQNIGNHSVDVTGWSVVVSDSYTNINVANSITQSLSGTMNPSDIVTYTDGVINPWGNDIRWSASAPGWVMIIDDLGNVIDFVAWGWLEDEIHDFDTTVNSFSISINNNHWVGDGLPYNNLFFYDNYDRDNRDHDDITDWLKIPLSSLGRTNPTLALPVSLTSRCSKGRTPVQVLVTPESDAQFTYTQNKRVVTFTNTTVEIPTHIYSYFWDFGDGSTSTEKNPTHTYLSNDTWMVELTVTVDNNDKCGKDSVTNDVITEEVGIKEISTSGFSFFPNPVSDKLILNWENGTETGSYTVLILDAQGKSVLKKAFKTTSGSFNGELDMSTVPPGFYILQLKSSTGIAAAKLIVE